jgi:hypothetical protein
LRRSKKQTTHVTPTESQIAHLAPDAAALAAGRGLAQAARWSLLGRSEAALWGEIKGSGSTPYRVGIDLRQLAYKCSCPSRKFPCKHGLALLLLAAQQPQHFGQSAPEAWLTDWLAQRSSHAAAPESASDTDEAADEKRAKDKAKRQENRLLNAQAGAAELEVWLTDLVRSGLLTLPERGKAFFEKMAARLIDAQVPALAQAVRQLGELDYHQGVEWQAQALDQVGTLWLMARAMRQFEALPDTRQADLRAALGFGLGPKDVLADDTAESLHDRWWVLGRQREVVDNVTAQRDWLIGLQSGRKALIINFAYQNAPIESAFEPGTVVEAELVFFPSSVPLRAVLRSPVPQVLGLEKPAAMSATWADVRAEWVTQASHLAWLRHLPFALATARIQRHDNRWGLVDAAEQPMLVAADQPAEAGWQLLALTGGQAYAMALLFDGEAATPLGVWVGERYFLL